GLGFVCFDEDEIGFAGLGLLGHEAPLHAGREAGAAAAAKAGRLDDVDDRVLAERHQRLRVVPVAAPLRALQAPILEAVEVGEDAVLVVKHQRGPSIILRTPKKTAAATATAMAMPTSLKVKKTTFTITQSTTTPIRIATASEPSAFMPAPHYSSGCGNRDFRRPSRRGWSGRLRARWCGARHPAGRASESRRGRAPPEERWCSRRSNPRNCRR